MSWDDRPADWGKPGHTELGSETEAILDQIALLTHPVETAYTVAWTSSGAAPAIGNGALTGTYWRTPGSLFVDAEIVLAWGTTTTGGTGVWLFSLPVTGASSQANFTIGTGYWLDSGLAEGGGLVKMESTTTFRILPAVNNADDETNWGPTTPIAVPANNDRYRATIRYRTA